MKKRELVKYSGAVGFHYFELRGELDTYKISVIEVPRDVEGEGWHGDLESDRFYKVINEGYNTTSAMNTAYSFMKFYFDGENKNYMPKRINIRPEHYEDFAKCVAEFVYPVI